MKLIIGLGNPGSKYIKNRHNAGHLFIDAIGSPAGSLQHDGVKVLKTNTFMNDSGRFVKSAINNGQWAINDLYIVHDDLDIPLGQYKIQFGVGPKVHNGILSIENSLNSKDFWRIRIGVDNRKKDAIVSLQHDTGADYVLQDFTGEELEILKQVQDDIYAELKKRFIKN
mgnify:CR=1 FL=1